MVMRKDSHVAMRRVERNYVAASPLATRRGALAGHLACECDERAFHRVAFDAPALMINLMERCVSADRSNASGLAKQARRRADDLFSSLFDNDDDANHALALEVLEGRYTFLEEGIVDPAELGGAGAAPQVAGQPEGTPAGKDDGADKADGATPIAAKVQ